MKKLLFVLIFTFSLLLLAACGSDDTGSEGDAGGSGSGEATGETGGEADSGDSGSLLEELQESGTVKVGFANEKPYAYEEDGELKGAAVDIAKAVFKELGVDNVEGQLADFAQLIPGLNAGKFHVITAGMAINPDRCANADFGEPEMMYGEGLVVQKGNPLDLKSYKDIAENPDATIAIMSGATENEFVKSEGVDPGQIQSVPDQPAAFSAVESGRATATTGTFMSMQDSLESLGSDKLELVMDFEQPNVDGVPSYGAAAFNKDNDELREAYNEVLKELKESGEIADLFTPYGFPAEQTEVPLDITTEQICSGEIK